MDPTLRRRNVILWTLVGVFAALILFAPLPTAAGAANERFIQIKAGSFAYDPATIRVDRGDLVTLELVSMDVAHGLYIDGYELETTSEPGQTTRLTFRANRSGSFRLRCSITCGDLHPFMIGKLNVGNNGLLWRAAGLSLLIMFAGLFLYQRDQTIEVIR
jgi:plastocyanin